MTRQTTFSFTLDPTLEQREALSRHVGAARFAFNQCLRLVLNALEAKQERPETTIPWSGFDLINAFNAWKRAPEAGTDEEGRAGLAWRDQVCQQVFEEAAVDLGRALEAVSSFRRGERKGKRPNMPRFKKKQTARRAFRLRNKGSGAKSAIRLGEELPRSVRLPKLGTIAVRECTRKLRRLLEKGRAKIWFATVSQRIGGPWRVTLNVEAADFHPNQRQDPSQCLPPVGIDRGLSTFAVVADREGQELERIDSPRPLKQYKASWYGAVLTVADRFYPSTRRCSACGVTGPEVPLSERTFHCSGCGREADRDTNAAANLAQYPEVIAPGYRPHVAAKHAETQNVCGEGSAGARTVWTVRETTFGEAERASAWRPRRAVLAETVNTL